MDLFLIYMAQFIFWLTCSHPLQATNRHHTLAKVLFIASILTIGLAYLGGRHLGLPGIVLGMIIGDLVLPFWFVPYLLRDYQGVFLLQVFRRGDGALCRESGHSGDRSLAGPGGFSPAPGMVAAVGSRANPGTDSVATTQKAGAFMRRRLGKRPYGGSGAGAAGHPGKS